eukprot:278886-Pyramimonas_sp.AAC.1
MLLVYSTTATTTSQNVSEYERMVQPSYKHDEMKEEMASDALGEEYVDLGRDPLANVLKIPLSRRVAQRAFYSLGERPPTSSSPPLSRGNIMSAATRRL